MKTFEKILYDVAAQGEFVDLVTDIEIYKAVEIFLKQYLKEYNEKIVDWGQEDAVKKMLKNIREGKK